MTRRFGINILLLESKAYNFAAIIGWLSHVSDTAANSNGCGGGGEWKLLPVSGKCETNSDHNARFKSPKEPFFSNTSDLRQSHHDGLLYAFYVRARYVYRMINNIWSPIAFLITFRNV